jgi:meckelin
MATLIEQLQREADDFCGHRGLQAGSDDQTFTMALPGKLRSSYDRIVLPASRLASGGRGPRLQQLPANAMKDIAEAYSNMNRFLTRFLEHVS